MIISKEQFFKVQQSIKNIPFNQTNSWLECGNLESICKIIYFVDNMENPQIACWGRETSRVFFGRKLMIDGIAYNSDIKHKVLTDFFKSLTLEGYATIEVSDIEKYSPTFEIGIRRAGFVRPWGLSLCPMSIIVNLEHDFNFHRNWKRNVKKSRELGNVFEHIECPTLLDARAYIELFSSLKDRKGVSYSLSSIEILNLLQGNYDLFFIKDQNGHYLSGRIEYRCGELIYDTYAATNSDGIKSGAAYQIQEDIFMFYKNRGYKRFDYGRISPSNNKMDDIFIAKSYSGGEPIGYNGQWLYTTSLFKYLLKKIYSSIIRNNSFY